ncbi:hypothetical protein EPUL_000397 [Erysiphe pulchra]|uniref:EF-hand domain-containing protein n=1 Tax=Erysiphe pulchra TaxID=225359 RepID=A0A2S4PW22_9PEZI|nr:hypothetical protein EPUL_000397 [Erysiphe pulchra]
MAYFYFYLYLILLAAISDAVFSESSKNFQNPIHVDPKTDWETRHMAEEHHIDSFDRASFFSLHDYDDNDVWDVSEVLKTYGMDDPSAKDVSEMKKNEITHTVFHLLDRNKNNIIERSEYIAFEHSLPDFGLGPGHHWDMETEYEIHHWQRQVFILGRVTEQTHRFRYHDENTKIEDLTHPEDIEHFKIHDQLEDEAEAQAVMDKLSIVEDNIPAKFKKT